MAKGRGLDTGIDVTWENLGDARRQKRDYGIEHRFLEVMEIPSLHPKV